LYSQEKDTIIYIPKTKYQSKYLRTKTDSINVLKKRAVMTAKNAKDLSKRMAELDSILNVFRKKAENIIRPDSTKITRNSSRKRINLDSINNANKAKNDRAARRLARLNAIVRRNDSIKKVKAQKAALRAAQKKKDSIRVAQNKLKAKLRNDSIRLAKSLEVVQRKKDSVKQAEIIRAQFRRDSIKVAEAKAIEAQRKQDSIRQAEVIRKAQLRQDSIRIVQANIAAQRRQDSIRQAEVIRKAQLRQDSIRIAQANIAAQRKQDSIRQAEVIRKAQLRQDSIRIAQANIAAQKRLDSIRQVQVIRKAQQRQDSIRIAQANIAAQKRQDSIRQAEVVRKVQLRQDSIRIALANIAAQRRQDSIRQIEASIKAQLRQDSIRIAQANIAAQRRQDSIRQAEVVRKAQLRQDSIRIAQANIAAQRRQDSIRQAEVVRKAQLRQDSIRIAQANIAAQRRQDSIRQAEVVRKAQLRQDSIRIAQANIAAQRRQDSIRQAEVVRKAQLRQDSIRIAQANIAAQRRQDSIRQAEFLRRAQLRRDSIRIAQENIIAQRKQDSVRIAQANIAAERRQDSIRQAEIVNRAKKYNDSLAIANSDQFNVNKNLNLSDSTQVSEPNLIENDFSNSGKYVDTIPYVRTGNILSKFIRPEIDLKKGEIVSNVLKVVNLGRTPVRFSTELLVPGGWTRIDDENRTFVAQQNDTVVVPIIISPAKLVNGNTEILINSFIIGSEQQQLANNYFTLKTKKKISWEIGLPSSQNIYLKNEEKNKRFGFQVRNTGNYKQDLFVNYTIPKNDIVLSDTLGKVIVKPNTTFTLDAGKRKNFDYIASFKDLNKRNYKRISINSYTPNKTQNKVSHGLIINSSEPRNDNRLMQKRTRLNFVKLPNTIKANPYGYPYIPLTVRLTAQNVLDDQSFLSLNLRGFKQLNKDASLIYSTNFNYNNTYFSNEILKNAPWYIGYFDEKKSIEIGQVSSNSVGVGNSGKGIKGSYRFNDTHQVGAYYVNSNGFFGSRSSIGFGLWHMFNYNEDIQLRTQLGRNINSISNRTLNSLSLFPQFTINKHNIGITGVLINKKQENEPAFFKSNGLLLGLNYSSYFFNKRLRVNFSTRFNDRNFGFSFYDRFSISQRTNYNINDNWSVFLNNNYLRSSRYNLFTGGLSYFQETFFNNLIFNTKTESGSYQPGLYYEYRNFPNNVLHSRGVTFRYANYQYEKNFLNSIYLKAGYTKPTFNNTDNKDYFAFEFSSLTRYRTWSFNTRYNLGAFSTLTSQQNLNDFVTPQSIRLSAQNQYLFANKHLALESSVVYSYNNVFSNHTLGVYPTVYYFTNSGWRFGMSANYTFSTRDYSSVYDNIDNQTGDQFNNYNETTTNNFNLNFSLKKDFGIPIPFVDRTANTVKFVAFLDINGNGIKDKEESTLENVVVKIDKKEVLTDINGEAIVENILKDEHTISAFSLENLNGWFPNLESTIIINDDDVKYVPFVRGIKVYGDVILDRQRIAVTDDKPIDLSRIKISASKNDKIYSALTNASGRFEFYLPFGDYIITMDEGVLNDRLQITRNNIPLKLKSTQDGVYVSFYIIEKRRKVIFTDFTKKKN
jgi:hypothetical protein